MHRAGFLLLLVVVFVGMATSSYAQSTRRPDLNIFGRGQLNPEQELSVRGNLGASFYDSITESAALPGGRAGSDHGWGTFGSAAVGYNLRFANLRLDGSLGAFASYYPELGTTVRVRPIGGAGTGLGWAFELTPKTQLGLSTSVRYRSLSEESILPMGRGFADSTSLAGDPTQAFLPRELDRLDGSYLSSSAEVSLRHEINTRWSLSATYGGQRDFIFGNAAQQLGLWSHSGGTAVHFAVTRSLSVRGGYRYHETRYRDGRPFRGHSADLGVDFGQGLELQLARRTTLTLGAGAAGYVDRAGSQRYRIDARAHLQHQMGRTWSSYVNYIRGLDSSQLLFQEPVLSDNIAAGLNGLLTRRLGFHAAVSGQRGAVGFIAAGHGVIRIAGNVGLQYSLARRLAISTDYTYYRFSFEAEVRRPAGLPAQSSSQGVSVHLSTWAPLFQRGRSNATR